jgi:glutamate 5-kinase
LTDVNGLYDADPKQNQGARLISSLPKVTPQLLKQLASHGRGQGRAQKTKQASRGTGGMYSKIRAAHEATRSGIETWLVRGDQPGVLVRVARGESVGTRVASARK